MMLGFESYINLLNKKLKKILVSKIMKIVKKFLKGCLKSYQEYVKLMSLPYNM